MHIFNIHAAKTHLSRLIDEAAAGDEIIIARAGKPVARLVPLTAAPAAGAPAKPKRVLGSLAGQIRVADDFDAPLPDDLLDAFEAR
jgi:prevent-host-death family protein